MTITRSMTRRRRETAVDERRIPPSGRRQPPQVHPKSKNGPKRKSRLMPLVDESINYQGPKEIKEMLRKRHAYVMKYLQRDRTGEEEIDLTEHLATATTHCVFTKHATPEDEIEALTNLGVIWGGGRPPLTKKNFTAAEEYSRSERLEIVLEMVIRNCKLSHTDVISLLSLSRLIHHKLISCKSLWETLDLRGMTNVGDRLVAAISQPRYQDTVKHINLEGAQDITDDCLVTIGTSSVAPYLVSLNISWCEQNSGAGIIAVVRGCPRLENLVILKPRS